MREQGGYILLFTALFVSIMCSLILVGGLYRGSTQSLSSSALVQADQARALADSCAEHALQLIRNNSSFVGSGSLTIGSNSCSYTVNAGAPQFITTSATFGIATKNVRVNLSATSPNPVISGWFEQ